MKLLYRGKEKIHSETELIIYQIKWYSSTSIINLALLVLHPKLVLLLTDVLSELSLCFSFCFCFFFRFCFCFPDTVSFMLPRYRKSRVMSHYTTEIKKPNKTYLSIISTNFMVKYEPSSRLYQSYWNFLFGKKSSKKGIMVIIQS